MQQSPAAYAQSIPTLENDSDICDGDCIITQFETGPPAQSRSVVSGSESTIYLPVMMDPSPVPEPSQCVPDPAGETSNITDALTICHHQIVTGQVSPENRWDVYKIIIGAGRPLTVELSGVTGDADLLFYAPGITDVLVGFPAAWGTRDKNSNEMVLGTTLAEGMWYLLVIASEGTTDYTIKVSIAEAVALPACAPGPGGDADNIADAIRLCPNLSVSGQVDAAEDPWDVYRVAFPAGRTTTECKLTGSADGAQLRVYLPTATDVLSDSAEIIRSTPGLTERFLGIVSSLQNSDWYVAVKAVSGSIDYVLRTSQTFVGRTAPLIRNMPCYWFPSGPTDTDWMGCVDDAFEIRRQNVSFSMGLCCGAPDGHYTIEADARLVQGEGEYALVIDIVSIPNEGGYLFGINPRNGTYALHRNDNGNWKDNVPLINWTPSPHIRRDLESNHMRIERNQDNILLWINGQHVNTVVDGTYRETAKMWGLYVRNHSQPNSIMRFSNIREWRWPN